MSITIPDRVVVFDYGEVISRTPTDADRAALLALAGVEAETFWPAYWRHRDELDQGTLSTADYWRRLADEFGTAWSASRVHELWVAEMDAIKPDPAIYLEVARDLGIAPEQMVFIDNKSVNTDAAAALGMTVHHFTGVVGLERFLRSLT